MSTASKNHVIIIDGTQSRLKESQETNAGILYKLLLETLDKKKTTLHYDPGVQGHGFWNWVTLASGLGINNSIKRAYDLLSSKYRPGDNIYLFGFSRGAYAVRSVAGMINDLGLLRQNCATERNLRQAFRLYEGSYDQKLIKDFRGRVCHHDAQIKMIGVWDTVKALGLPYPLLTRLAPMATEFHNDKIGAPVRFGFHALALDENRTAYKPVLWDIDAGWNGTMEQVWFKGAHADVGGHVFANPDARGLSNIPLCWMLEKVEQCGLDLPNGWAERYPVNPDATPIGSKRGIAKLFLFRSKRALGQKYHEYIHPSAVDANTEYDLPILPIESQK